MKRNVNATCGTCPYWAQDKDIKKGGGECRINEPKLFTFPDNVYYVWLYTKPTEWCGQHPDFWEAEAAEQGTLDCDPPALEDVLAAYRRAVEMGGRYDGRVCDACAHPHTVVCGRCLVGWQLQFQPKESAK